MRAHQLTCELKPENMQRLEESATTNSRSLAKTSPALHIIIPQTNVSVNQFMKELNLVPQAKAKKLRESCRRSTEVNTIDFSDPQVPVSPTTPKTPKLLISQDSNLNKRRLSLSYQSQQENSSDTESTTSSENEEHEGKRRVIKSTSLFSIPITSELGSRVLKLMVSDSATPRVLTNVEEFCKTPKKNRFADRLRVRENTFIISHRQRKRYRFSHSYKFSKAQRDEFLLTLKTGLDSKSRKLLRSLPDCSVRLVYLTRRRLRKYVRTARKKMVQPLNPVVSVTKLNDSYFFPRKPILLTENIDSMLGLRKKMKKQTAELSPMNVVSENTNVDLLKQKVVVYRSLLTDLSMSTARQKLQFSKCERRVKKTSKEEKESASEIVAHKYLQAKQNLHYAENKTCSAPSVKPHFPHLTELLEKKPTPSCALSPTSTDSSPEATNPLDHPLNIDIPSLESSLTDFLRTCDQDKQLRENSSPDRISIVTISSDDSSLHEHCCMGCQLKKQCWCTPNKGGSKEMASETCTPCKTQLQSINKISCDDTESPKRTEQGKASVSNDGFTIGGNKIQTRSSGSILSLGIRRQTSAPAGCSLYSLRSNLTSKMNSSKQESLKRCKNSKNQQSEVLSYPKKKESCVESLEEHLQHSLITETVDEADMGLKNKTLQSNSVSVFSPFSPKHLTTSGSPSKIMARPSTRSSATKCIPQSENSSQSVLPATLKLARQKDKVHMTTRSSCVKHADSEGQKPNIVGRLSGHVVRSLNFCSTSEDSDKKESDGKVDGIFAVENKYTRVDAEILLKNVYSISSQSKQKPFDSQTVKRSPQIPKSVGTLTRSKTDTSDVALKKRKLDL